MIAFRWGTTQLARLGVQHGMPTTQSSSDSILTMLPDAHGHGVGSHTAHGPEGNNITPPPELIKPSNVSQSSGEKDAEEGHSHHAVDDAMAQIIGVAILEFGIVLHRRVKRIVFWSSRSDRIHIVCSSASPWLSTRTLKSSLLLSSSIVSFTLPIVR